MKSATMLAIASSVLAITSPWSAEAQEHAPTLAPFEPPAAYNFDVSYTADCYGVPLNIVWRTRKDRSVITHMSLGSTQPSAAQLARFNSWVGRLRGDIAARAACDSTGAWIVFKTLSDDDNNKYQVQFDWMGAEDRLLIAPDAPRNG